jgi:hypothetical protein
MGRFHSYSLGNILEIARQRPSATRVAGMYAWNQLGRRINKGEKGIRTIRESTTNPRRTFDEGKLQELAESIRHHGLIQPITVRPNSEGFELIAGARRYRAAQLAELFSIPARIVEIDDTQALNGNWSNYL